MSFSDSARQNASLSRVFATPSQREVLDTPVLGLLVEDPGDGRLTGKAVRALMQEPEGARLVGIQTARIHALCFGAGIAMSAVTGSLVSMLFELTPFMGLPYTVTALVVVILGGLGNMLGCLAAGLLLGLVETAGVYLASSDIRLISSYAVLSLILLLRPSGLFGR